MDHAEPLSRSIFREVVVRLAKVGGDLDFGALARDAYAAADAYEAEGVRRLKAERGECSGCGTSAIDCGAMKENGAVACCPDCKHEFPQKGPGSGSDVPAPPNEQGAANGSGRGEPSAPERPASSSEPKKEEAPKPSPRWGTVRGRPVAYHLWANPEAAEAECGETETSEEPIEFRHDAPETADQVCVDCLALSLPAAERWRETLVVDPEPTPEPEGPRCPEVRPGSDSQCEKAAGHDRECYAEAAGIWRKDQCYHPGPTDPVLGSDPKCCLARGHEGPHVSAVCPTRYWNDVGDLVKPAKAKKPRAPCVCRVPGCGKPGKRVRNAAGAFDDRGLWCPEHGAKLSAEERRSVDARHRRLAKEGAMEVAGG